jgi:hypothetical protein
VGSGNRLALANWERSIDIGLIFDLGRNELLPGDALHGLLHLAVRDVASAHETVDQAIAFLLEILKHEE